MKPAGRADVAFLFLGEMLLVPHLWPIVDALARLKPDLRIDLWISTSVHEALIGAWLDAAHQNVRLRRAPGFRTVEPQDSGRNPVIPSKIAMLMRLAPHLMRTRVVLCAEQTSLWLPRVLPMAARFIFTVHGAGPLNYNRDGRLKKAYRLFVPSDYLTPEHVAHGIRPDRITVTGYAKSSFSPSVTRADLFVTDRPILFYAPHWQRYRSSWWEWGRQIVAMLAAQQDFNVILAPHQRLFERDPAARDEIAAAAALPHIHADSGSFAMVDGSYSRMADLYLGDSSSQIVEYLAQPRPCVLLDTPGMTWRVDEAGGYRGCGEIVRTLDDLWRALESARERHRDYRAFQQDFAARALGDTSGQAPVNAANAILDALAR